MNKLMFRSLTIVTVLALAVLGLSGLASAHEERGVGDLEMIVGFGTEPAYTGVPNSVQLILVHHGEPVTDLGDDLDVEVEFGDQTKKMQLEPFFEKGEFGTPGDYRAWFIPTRPGAYALHFTGKVEGEKVDETFTSGPDTFSEIVDPAEAAFPVSDPTTAQLAERIEREIPRLSDAVSAALKAAEAAGETADDAKSFRTLAIVAIVVGGLGLVVGLGGIAFSLRRRT